MKQISKRDWERIEKLLEELSKQKPKIEGMLGQLQAQLDTMLEETNSIREEIRGVVEDLANEAEQYYDERSEKWQDSDNGQQYQQWIQNIRDVETRFTEDFTIDISAELLAEIDELVNVTDGDLTQSPDA